MFTTKHTPSRLERSEWVTVILRRPDDPDYDQRPYDRYPDPEIQDYEDEDQDEWD